MEPILNHRHVQAEGLGEAEIAEIRDRDNRYRRAARVVADVLDYLGYPISDETRENWSSMFSRLSVADAMAERQPDIFGSGAGLVCYLGIPARQETVIVAQQLLEANATSITAPTIDEHLDARYDEAIAAARMLQHQGDELRDSEEAFEVIAAMAVAGIYCDSALDASEDAESSSVLSVGELRRGAAMRLVSEIRDFDGSLFRALVKASTRNGLTGHLIRRSLEIPGNALTELYNKRRKTD